MATAAVRPRLAPEHVFEADFGLARMGQFEVLLLVAQADQAAHTQVLQAHFTAMAVGDAARYSQPQAIALLLPGQAKVRLKHLLKTLFGQPD